MQLRFVPVIVVLALASLAAAYTVAARLVGVTEVAPAHAAPAFPSAQEFARSVVELTSAYARDHGHAVSVDSVQCVQASPGHYMCSYAVASREGGRECHLMQAQWTPSRASSVTVTLAGKTKRCGTLREAIASLQ